MSIVTRVVTPGRVDTDVIRKIVDGDDPLWHDGGDAPLEAVETPPDDEQTEDEALEESTTSEPATAVVDGSIQYWDAGIVRHRHKELFGMALYSWVGTPARAVYRYTNKAVTWLWYRAWAVVYWAAWRVTQGWARVSNIETWRAVPGKIRRVPQAIASYGLARKRALMRTRARYRAAQRRITWGFTIRRQMATRASKVAFMFAISCAIWCAGSIAALLALNEFNMAMVIYGAAATTGFLFVGFYFDVVAERADTHQMDLAVSALEERNQNPYGVWLATTTRTDIQLPRTVSPRLHERAVAMPPALPRIRPVSAGYRGDWT